MPFTTVPIQITTLRDNLWDKLKANQPNLGFSEAELVANRELFVWIMVSNGLDNLRRLPFRQINVPPRSALAEVVTTVRADPGLYAQKYFTWVEMDRCLNDVA